MPDIEYGRNDQRLARVREGGMFALALDGPQGEAMHVIIAIEDPIDDTFLRREFTPDEAQDIAEQMSRMAQEIKEGK